MSVFKTAYDTTPCRGQVLTKLQNALTRALSDNYVHPATGYTSIYPVVRTDILNELVPVFYHPFVMERNGEPLIFVDVRPFGKIDATSLDFIISNREGYDGAILRARLQDLWSQGNYSAIRSMMLPAMAYPQWVAETITRRLNLGPGEQQKIAILAGIFYLSQFSDEETVDKDEHPKIISQVSRFTGIKPNVVKDVVDRIQVIRNADEFCDIVKDELQSTRANNLNAATLYTIMAGTWYGANAAELVAVALEHPPTWASMVHQAVTNRSYHHAGLTKMLLDRTMYKNEIRNFVASLQE